MQRMFAAIAVVLAATTCPSSAALAVPVLRPSSQPAKTGAHDPPASAAALIDQLLPRDDRLFVAVFDCSWKNARNGPSEPTTARQIYLELAQVERSGDKTLRVAYVPTDCARDNWHASEDVRVHFVGTRLAAMYRQLAAQTAKWKQQDPTVRISVLSLGGSWGALQAAEFTNMVDAFGLRSPRGDQVVPPHRTAQALAMLDPVGKMPPNLYLPSSLISAFQLSAMDEHRPDFQTLPILPAGLSHHDRYANLPVPGSLYDVCGGYRLNGLSIRSANLLVDYINRLSDVPLLKKQPEPDDPQLNVVHRSEEEGT